MQEVDEVKPFKYRSSETEICQKNEVQKEQRLPDHLQDRYKRSCKNTCISRQQSKQLKQLLIKHQNVFAKSSNDLGRTSVVKHKIHVQENVKPIKQRPRRAPMAFAKEGDKIIEEQLKAGVISES